MASSDDILLDVFEIEAQSALQVLGAQHSEAPAREAAIANLERAARLTGVSPLISEVQDLCCLLRDRDDRATLLERFIVTFRDRFTRRRRPPEPLAGPPPAPAPSEQADESVSDETPTAVTRRPVKRRRSTKFDTSEHKTLLSFFRDEAYEALEGLTGALLAAGSQRPLNSDLEQLMRITHTLKGAAGTVDLPLIAELTHQLETCLARVRADKLGWSASVQDSLVEAADSLRGMVSRIENADFVEAGASRLRAQLGRLLDEPEIEPDTDKLPVIAEVTADEGEPAELAAGRPARSAESDRDAAASASERRRRERRRDETPLLRIDPARVDRIMDSVGELVFDRTRIERRVAELATLARAFREIQSQFTGAREAIDAGSRTAAEKTLKALDERLASELEAFDKTARALSEDSQALRRTEFALQDGLTGIRMQSARALFKLLAPQLRSIARATGRRAELVTSGNDTEFDKSVADQIVDPLIQIIRNALAHGIESVADRVAAGKSEIGRISLSARQEGNSVVLEIADDGAGIDPRELRQRFVASGRWSESRARIATDEEILRTLFEPGVSSLDEASTLAGRGVGLSAVYETVTRLGGEVLISSIPGKGTAFTLRLPLTTAISNAMLFKVGGHVFAVPSTHVIDTVATDTSAVHRSAEIRVRNDTIPLVGLQDLLGFEMPSDLSQLPVIVIEYASRKLAFTCDKVVGPREIFVKSLGPLLSSLPLFAGGTISGSGKVQLILDPAHLIKIAYPRSADSAVETSRVTDRAREDAPERILVVDDSRAICLAMKSMLERAGYQVDTAEDGDVAWALMQRQPYDALVTDLEMPRLSGFDLIGRVRASDTMRAMPVVVISSVANRENRDRARALDVRCILDKPVTPGQLVSALMGLTGAARRQRS